MAADGKWIKGLTADMAVADAAQIIVADRFDTVSDELEKARDELCTPDAVHDLRVASRRAATALRVFDDAARSRPINQLKKQLRKLRHAAGDVRNIDVLIKQIQDCLERRSSPEWPGLDYLCGLWSQKRESAAAPLAKLLRRHKHWQRRARHLNMRHQRRRPLGEFAFEIITDFKRRFDDSQTNARDPDELHAIRIAGKRLRYAFELFGELGDHTRIEQTYALLEELQDTLGTVHDAWVNAQAVNSELAFLNSYHASTAHRYRPGLEELQKDLEAHSAAGPEKFRDWLARWTRTEFPLEIGVETDG